MSLNFAELKDADLASAYGDLVSELKRHGIIRTKNLVGDLAEYLAIGVYNNTKGLPNLEKAPAGTKNIDAIGRNGMTYSIKGTTGKTTGVFYGFPPKGDSSGSPKRFDFVIVVLLDESYRVKRINELTWDCFLQFKRWHSRMNAWNLSINRKLLNASKTIFDKDSGYP